MELILFFLLLILISSVVFALQCFIFFGFTGRPLLLAFTLSWKLAMGAIVGVLALGFGGILLPAIWINSAIDSLPNYSKLRDIAFAFVIATIGAVITYVVGFALAWEVIG